MERIETGAKVMGAAVGGWFSYLLGGWDGLLAALVILAGIDILTGFASAVAKRSDKSESGGLSSQAMWCGGIKKILMFCIVAVAVVADRLIGDTSTLIRSITIGYYIASEALSILENAMRAGLPVPVKLRAFRGDEARGRRSSRRRR